ncbi:hypothetical protein Ocin01_14949 [Orchesella cincta]|uniref:EF-hand domain-containing protein n=1 Tax=Orchesella cincta TaxID=48709 RepID=A0A1D2MFQ0_ORCCI|nr:hypothetical protein Ocin01_14949 [Orchesella cincta]
MANSTHFALVALGILLSVIISENQVAGDCCNSDDDSRCRDHTAATPCCGYGKCNMFCCNCRCRGRRSEAAEDDEYYGDRRRRQSRGPSEVDYVIPAYNRRKRDAPVEIEQHKHDANKDGFYDILEAHRLLESGSCGNYTEKIGQFAGEFYRMDKDKDGKLSYEEING